MGRGRPLKDVGRKKWYISLRFDNEFRRMLVYLMDKTGETKAEIMRSALKMYYTLKKNDD